MSIFNEQTIDAIISGLANKIAASKGVEICFEQESNNLENWVQIELVDILVSKFNGYEIGIEEKNHDVVLKKDGLEIAVIEIKIVSLGGKASVKLGRLKEDINKLLKIDNNARKLFLCVVHAHKKPNVVLEEGWDFGKAHKEGYRGELINLIAAQETSYKNLSKKQVVIKEGISFIDYFLF